MCGPKKKKLLALTHAGMSEQSPQGTQAGGHQATTGASSPAQKQVLRAPGPVAFTGILVALGPECFAVSPADPRFNPEFVDEALAEVLAHEEEHPVSVKQVSSQVQGDLVLVTLIDAAGPSAVSSKSLSQTLMIQALNPKSYLRRHAIGTPLREQPAPITVVAAEKPTAADQDTQQTRFSERDIAAFALCKLAQDQQHLVEKMGAEIRALQQALDDRLGTARRSISPIPKNGILLPEQKDSEQIESKLDQLRELTIRQVDTVKSQPPSLRLSLNVTV